MSENFVTLATYTYTTESYLLVAKLETEGIKSVVKNENLLSTQQFLSNAVGGLEVQVMEKDLERAKIILKELEELSKPKVPEELAKDYKKVLIYCPQCESTNVYKRNSGLFSFGASEHVCADCGHKWKQ